MLCWLCGLVSAPNPPLSFVALMLRYRNPHSPLTNGCLLGSASRRHGKLCSGSGRKPEIATRVKNHHRLEANSRRTSFLQPYWLAPWVLPPSSKGISPPFLRSWGIPAPWGVPASSFSSPALGSHPAKSVPFFAFFLPLMPMLSNTKFPC